MLIQAMTKDSSKSIMFANKFAILTTFFSLEHTEHHQQ